MTRFPTKQAILRATNRLGQNESGLAILELAIVAPILIVISIATYDLFNAITTQSQLAYAAELIASSTGAVAVQSDQSTTLTSTTVLQQLSAVFAIIPSIRNGAANGTNSVTMSSITWVGSPANCGTGSGQTACTSYTPQVAWSVAYQNANITFSNVLRPCTGLQAVASASQVPGNLTTLGLSDTTNHDPLLVVDIHVQYIPKLSGGILHTKLDLWQTAMYVVRSMPGSSQTSPAQANLAPYTTLDPGTTYSASTSSGLEKCPGYNPF